MDEEYALHKQTTNVEVKNEYAHCTVSVAKGNDAG